MKGWREQRCRGRNGCGSQEEHRPGQLREAGTLGSRHAAGAGLQGRELAQTSEGTRGEKPTGDVCRVRFSLESGGISSVTDNQSPIWS